MARLRNVVLQLEKERAIEFESALIANKAEKYHTLFTSIRKGGLSYDKIQETIGVNSAAFYTLKSRLYDKIQEFLLEGMDAPKVGLLRKVSNIPTLLYDTPKATAIAVLKKMEKDLISFDMQNELIEVYSALKKLHLYSDKYFEYTQLYNKHLAYKVAIDKAEDLLGNFTKQLGDWQLARKPETLELFPFIKKEMDNICKLYKSHSLYIYKCIIDSSLELFLPLENHTKEDEPVEDMLEKCQELIANYPKSKYHFLGKIITFLQFEYYSKHGLKKKQAQFFDGINANVANFMLYDFNTVSSMFLLSKTKYFAAEYKYDELIKESKELEEIYTPQKHDTLLFVNFNLHTAAAAFHNKKYNKTCNILNQLLGDVVFKHYPHAEVEIKLLLIMAHSMQNEYDVAYSLVRSVQRKINELDEKADYSSANTLLKMLKKQIGNINDKTQDNMLRLRDRFELLNKTSYSVLPWFPITDELVERLSEHIKE